jgi:hypothetical protein
MVVTMRPPPDANRMSTDGYLANSASVSVDVPLGRGIGHVAPVEQRVDPDRGDALLGRLAQDLVQVADVGVHVAVRQQPDEMKSAATRGAHVDDSLPRRGGPDGARCNGLVDPLRTLIEDPTRTEDVVADLGVAHVGVRRQTDGGSVCPQGAIRPGREPVERRSVRERNGIELVAETDADTVHHDEDERSVTTQLAC